MHDAIVYATTDADARDDRDCGHPRPSGGTVIVLPDYVKETFTPGTVYGGEKPRTAAACCYLEWRWEPRADDDTCVVDDASCCGDADGGVRTRREPFRCRLTPSRSTV